MSSPAPVLTIDGPGGAGKGTVSRAISKFLGWNYLDSGAIYRSLAVHIIREKISLEDQSLIAKQAEMLQVSFYFDENFTVILGGEDITDQLTTEDCGDMASRVAAYPEVRQALLKRQREYRKTPGLVADGRDMGTVVFPDATYKIYLIASAKTRAQRRYKQLKEKGMDVNLEKITKELEDRDRRDKSRANAPLKKASDAVVIDSSGLSVEKVIEESLKLLGK